MTDSLAEMAAEQLWHPLLHYPMTNCPVSASFQLVRDHPHSDFLVLRPSHCLVPESSNSSNKSSLAQGKTSEANNKG